MQDRKDCLAKALDEVKTAFPRDMENDKAMLIMTMLLAKKSGQSCTVFAP